MGRALLVFILTVTACGAQRFTPEPLDPGHERVMALARQRPAERHASPDRTDLEVQTMPRVILAGGAVWVRCFVPRKAEHRALSFGIATLRTSAQQLDGADAAGYYEILIEHIPCGSWLAYCATEDSAGEITRRTFTLKALGDCPGGRS